MKSKYLSLYSSQLKTEITLSLLKSPKRLSELKNDIASSSTTILHAIKDLKDLDLVFQQNKSYKLTSLGLMEAYIIKETLSSIMVIENFKEFWLNHDLAAIPPHLILKIGALRDSNIIKNQATELNIVHRTFQTILEESDDLWGASPIFHPDYIMLFERLLRQGTLIKLIITDDVFNHILTLANTVEIVNYIKENKLSLFIIDELKIGFTITDKHLSLGLFNNMGEYDYNMDLVSISQESLEWGRELFQYYQNRSKKIDSEVLSFL